MFLLLRFGTGCLGRLYKVKNNPVVAPQRHLFTEGKIHFPGLLRPVAGGKVVRIELPPLNSARSKLGFRSKAVLIVAGGIPLKFKGEVARWVCELRLFRVSTGLGLYIATNPRPWYVHQHRNKKSSPGGICTLLVCYGTDRATASFPG